MMICCYTIRTRHDGFLTFTHAGFTGGFARGVRTPTHIVRYHDRRSSTLLCLSHLLHKGTISSVHHENVRIQITVFAVGFEFGLVDRVFSTQRVGGVIDW